MKLTDRLSSYSKQCLTERLDADFAEAVQEIVETSQENKNLKEKPMNTEAKYEELQLETEDFEKVFKNISQELNLKSRKESHDN